MFNEMCIIIEIEQTICYCYFFFFKKFAYLN